MTELTKTPKNRVYKALHKPLTYQRHYAPLHIALPNESEGYNPQRDLQNVYSHAPTTGKAIPELKFVFWQKMFTSRHDQRLWEPYLRQVMPHLDPAKPVSILREDIYNNLEQIRFLRNRIAHHEPIFARNLNDDLQTSSHSLLRARGIPPMDDAKPAGVRNSARAKNRTRLSA